MKDTRKSVSSNKLPAHSRVHPGIVRYNSQCTERAWVSSHLEKRECINFIKKPDPNNEFNNDPLCQCNYTRSQHSAATTENDNDTEWQYAKHTKSMPTDAFGEVCFVGYNKTIGRYARVDVNSDMKDIWELMREYWGLHYPNLLISVVGGSQRFIMKPRLREVFNSGLIKAAETTKAWIITGGMNAGVVKYVGKAVRDHILAYGNQHRIACIGIGSWGCVSNREKLQEEKLNHGLWPALYDWDPRKLHPLVEPLDPNHTHFLLVDNGTQKQFSAKSDFRVQLEAFLSQIGNNVFEGNVTIPLVCIVLDGGPGTLSTVKKAIYSGTPAVVIEGSGRAADILAYAYANCEVKKIDETDSQGKTSIRSESIMSSNVINELRMRMEKEFDYGNMDTNIACVKECLQKKEHITIFRLDSAGSSKDLDKAILNALLKVNKGKSTEQLQLALAWNRADVATESILTEDNKWEPSELDEMMFVAIQHNKVDFVKLFKSNGVSLRKFLTKKRMLALYNQSPTNSLLKILLTKYKTSEDSIDVNFQDIGNLIKELMGDFYQPLYHSDRYENKQDTEKQLDVSTKYGPQVFLATEEWLKAFDFDEPSRDLFIWSVLMLRQEMSFLFWDDGKNAIAASLTAIQLLKSMRLKTNDSELIKNINTLMEKYRQMSIDVLSSCYSADEGKARKLLVRVQPYFGNTTSLQLAVEADNKEFISHSACQSLLNNIWMGKMAQENGYIRLTICTILFPLIYILIRWRKTAFNEDEISGDKSQENKSRDQKPYSCLDKFIYFYNAPVIIFGVNCASYFAFLILYSIVLLTRFNPMPNIDVLEMVVIAWAAMLLCEEIRQIVMADYSKFSLRLEAYFHNHWNILDMVTLLSFVLGLVLRLIPPETCSSCFEPARIILALNLMTFTFRVLHMFSVLKHLGPKLVMIGSMMIDMVFFMIILSVFIAAYGLALQAILYPNSKLDQYLLRNILYKAYWQIYGELFLEELEGDVPDCSGNPEVYNNRTLGIPRCPENDWFGPILLGVYILITNVMMLNLLIAMFSYTFSTIQEQSDLHWNFQRYALVWEFYSKPPLPPPFIFISHIYLIFKACCRTCGRCDKTHTDFRKEFKTQTRQLVLWENMNADDYQRNIKANETLQIENRVKENNERVSLIGNQVEMIDDRLSNIETALKVLLKDKNLQL